MSDVQNNGFQGFPRKILTFLGGLTNNNNKDWFEAHRSNYEDDFLTPAKAFVTAMGPPLRKLSRDIHAEARVNGSLMRIHRDTRFSADKTPYKDHLDLMFWAGSGRSRECPALFFRLTAERLYLGAGKHGFDSDEMAAYRAAVNDNRKGRQLARALAKITESGDYQLGGSHYKRVPRGFDKDHERADLLRHNGLHVMYEVAVPAVIHKPELVDHCLGHYQAMLPVLRWLVALRD